MKPSEELFKALLETAPDGMIIVDQQGKIMLANAQTEKLFGYAKSELIGQPIEMLIPQRFHGAHSGHRADYGHNPKARFMGSGMELLGKKKDGTEVPVEISLGPLKTEEGLLVSAAVRDITERKRTEEALRQSYQKLEQTNTQLEMASRLKSQFLANMSHELRTPLNSIIGFVEIIHDGRAGEVNADQREYLADVLGSSRHLLQLINDVLDLAKIEAGKVRLEFELIDLPALMRQAMALLRAQAEKKRIRIVVQPDESLSGVHGDPTRIKQILYNYLSNAIKFSPEGVEVVLRSRAEGQLEYRIEVEDQGIGIAASDHARLFKDFEQLESGTDKKFQGTGLGLSLTRKIVETMGGRVGFESEPSQGSRFFAILPIRSADEMTKT